MMNCFVSAFIQKGTMFSQSEPARVKVPSVSGWCSAAPPELVTVISKHSLQKYVVMLGWKLTFPSPNILIRSSLEESLKEEVVEKRKKATARYFILPSSPC